MHQLLPASVQSALLPLGRVPLCGRAEELFGLPTHGGLSLTHPPATALQLATSAVEDPPTPMPQSPVSRDAPRRPSSRSSEPPMLLEQALHMACPPAGVCA